MLTRDQILQTDDLPREVVHVPEWGGSVWVRTLTGRERDTFESETVLFAAKGESKPNLDALYQSRARLCARAICDETGARLFTDADVTVLGAKSAAALDRVYEVAARLSKIGKSDMEDLEKNSATARAAASSSS